MRRSNTYLFSRRQLLVRAAIFSVAPFLTCSNRLFAQSMHDPVVILQRLAFLLVPEPSVSPDIFTEIAERFVAKQNQTELQRLVTSFNSDTLGEAAIGQIEHLRAMQHDPLIRALRTETINTVYSQPEVWKKIGYGGSSLQFGGYLHQGFDTIDWLPEPPP